MSESEPNEELYPQSWIKWAQAELARLREENATLTERWQSHSCALDTIVKPLRAFVTEWSERFGFLATTHPRDSVESIDEVACLLDAKDRKLRAHDEAAQQMATRGKALIQVIGIESGARRADKITDALGLFLSAVRRFEEAGKC